MTAFARNLPFGATLMAPDRTHFRLWAPGRQKIELEIEGLGRMRNRMVAEAA